MSLDSDNATAAAQSATASAVSAAASAAAAANFVATSAALTAPIVLLDVGAPIPGGIAVGTLIFRKTA